MDDEQILLIKRTEDLLKEEETKGFPPNFVMIHNLGKDLWENAKRVGKKLPVLATIETVQIRFTTCQSCEFFIQDSSRCTKCGCFMKKKVNLEISTCPIGRW